MRRFYPISSFKQQTGITLVKSLFAGNSHAINAKCWTSKRTAELEITADFHDVVQHVLEISGDGDFFHGIGELAVFNPQAAGATGKVTGDQVHAEAEKLSYVQAARNICNDLLLGACAWLEIKITGACSWSPRQSSRCVAGSLESQLARRVGIEQIGFQHAFFDDNGTAGGNTFTVKGRGPEAANHGAIVNQRDIFAGNLLAQLIDKECSLAIDRVTGGCVKYVVEYGGGHGGIKHHRHPGGSNFACTDSAQGTARCFAPHVLWRIQLAQRTRG